MAKRGRPKKVKEEVKEEVPEVKEEVKEEVVKDADETSDSLPPMVEGEPVITYDEVSKRPLWGDNKEPGVLAEQKTIPGRPSGAPDPKDVAVEYENAGHHIYKLKNNKKVIIKKE